MPLLPVKVTRKATLQVEEWSQKIRPIGKRNSHAETGESSSSEDVAVVEDLTSSLQITENTITAEEPGSVDEPDAISEDATIGKKSARFRVKQLSKRPISAATRDLLASVSKDKQTSKGDTEMHCTEEPELEMTDEPESIADDPTEVKKKSRFGVETLSKRIAPVRAATIDLMSSTSFLKGKYTEEVESEETEKAKETEDTEEEEKKSSRLSVSQFKRFIPRRNSSMSDADTVATEAVAEGPDVEDVYIVLRPINFKQSSREILQRVGIATDMADLQKFLLLQHWGIKVGKDYYHLHIVEERKENGKLTKRLAVSLSEFENVTIKFPIWQTSKDHVERVKGAISTIQAMGKFHNEDDVQVFADQGELKEQQLSDEERKLYANEKKQKLWVPMFFTGEYNAATNSCVNFSARYLFGQIFDFNPRNTSSSEFKRKMAWLANKWVSSGCKIDKKKLLKMFVSPLGLLNPMRILTKTSDGNLFVVRLALVFMGKIQPDGTVIESPSPGMKVITEGEAKEAGPAAEKEADAVIEQVEEGDNVVEDTEAVEVGATDGRVH
ncbi:hypothetical protein BDQ17DRAFT_519855 [Cyathus striatus]|nr:hypothetical protein BDQ17DRAFT_519855 [Cyathus striatus]